MTKSGLVASLAVRAGVLGTGAGLVLAPSPLSSAGTTLTIIGVVLAIVWPREIGSTVASAGFVLAWIEATGWHRVPSTQHTIGAAAVLYLMHLSCGLAAWVPIGAEVEWAAIQRFLAGSTAPILAAAAFVALDLAVPSSSGSALVELAGLVGILGVVAAIVLPLRPAKSGSHERDVNTHVSERTHRHSAERIAEQRAVREGDAEGE